MKIVALGILGVIAIVIFFLFNPRIIYNLVIAFYHTGIKISSLWNNKASLWLKGRRNIFLELNNNFHFPNHKKIWIHCASLGEFEQGRPIIESLRAQYPKHKILLTFFSPSGYEVRKNYDKVDYVSYLPIDTKQNARKFFDIVQPTFVIFVKYEFWLHFVEVLHKNKKPLYLISAIFKKNMIFFKWYGKLFRNMLKKFTEIFVQEERSLKLLQEIKLTNATITYDTRFDRVLEVASNHTENEIAKKFTEGFNVLVAGSTWPTDERKVATAFYKNLVHSNFKLIIAPHNIDKNHLEKTKKRFEKFSFLYSSVSSLEDLNLLNKRVMIIDNIGMLSSLYKYADVCYVGGGFDKGIHNVLEAAVYRKPVFFGPKHKHSTEAIELVKLGSGFVVQTSDDLLKQLKFMGNFEVLYKGICANAGKYVSDRCGGTKKIIEKIKANL
ncbi:MAG: 3-deoxy-D-manno-octulosonic acid transferase [Chitinophagales bacterium]